MQKFVNDPSDLVAESLAGLVVAHPALAVDATARVVHRAVPKAAGLVGLVSGGGSGHEPLHTGFVGTGMLDAACAGEIFTSPVPDQVLVASRLADRGAGVLHVVKNYTGDVLNFDMGAELAACEGIEVATVVVADDVAVSGTGGVGRRGMGATVLLHKIAGAAAEAREPLSVVADLARRVADGSRSFGIALTSCVVPAVGRPTFDLPPGQMEVGVGIHGEPGRYRGDLVAAAGAAQLLVEAVLRGHGGPDSLRGRDAIVFLDGLGATPDIELYALFGQVARLLRESGVTIARTLVGSYLTCLDMAGAALTVLPADDDLLARWDAPVVTPALRWGA